MDTLMAWKEWHDEMMSYGDPRVEGWFFMSSPIPSMLVSILYVVLVGTSIVWMKKRAAFEIRPLMVAYNFIMVVVSAWLVHEFCISGWLTGYSLGCQPVDFSNSPKARRMVMACYVFYLTKFVEMLDTFFFIFRRRFELVTFLHVFHHAVLPPAWWWGIKFVPGGFGSFAANINSLVHAVMYLYYGLAAIGPQMQPYLWWKRYLTKFQMVQFITMVVHGMQLYFIECDYPRQFATAIMSFACIFFVLFANFYIQAYIKRVRTHKSEQSAKNGFVHHANGNGCLSNGYTNGVAHKNKVS